MLLKYLRRPTYPSAALPSIFVFIIFCISACNTTFSDAPASLSAVGTTPTPTPTPFTGGTPTYQNFGLSNTGTQPTPPSMPTPTNASGGSSFCTIINPNSTVTVNAYMPVPNAYWWLTQNAANWQTNGATYWADSFASDGVDFLACPNASNVSLTLYNNGSQSAASTSDPMQWRSIALTQNGNACPTIGSASDPYCNYIPAATFTGGTYKVLSIRGAYANVNPGTYNYIATAVSGTQVSVYTLTVNVNSTQTTFSVDNNNAALSCNITNCGQYGSMTGAVNTSMQGWNWSLYTNGQMDSCAATWRVPFDRKACVVDWGGDINFFYRKNSALGTSSICQDLDGDGQTDTTVNQANFVAASNNSSNNQSDPSTNTYTEYANYTESEPNIYGWSMPGSNYEWWNYNVLDTTNGFALSAAKDGFFYHDGGSTYHGYGYYDMGCNWNFGLPQQMGTGDALGPTDPNPGDVTNEGSTDQYNVCALATRYQPPPISGGLEYASHLDFTDAMVASAAGHAGNLSQVFKVGFDGTQQYFYYDPQSTGQTGQYSVSCPAGTWYTMANPANGGGEVFPPICVMAHNLGGAVQYNIPVYFLNSATITSAASPNQVTVPNNTFAVFLNNSSCLSGSTPIKLNGSVQNFGANYNYGSPGMSTCLQALFSGWIPVVIKSNGGSPYLVGAHNGDTGDILGVISQNRVCF